MTEEQKKIKRYVNALERRLKLPLKLKVRINEDIGTEIHLRMEAGESVDEILEEMGSPEAVAERFHEEYAEYVVKKSPIRFLFLGLAAFIIIAAVLFGIVFAQSHQTEPSISIIGGADGPTSIFIAGKTENETNRNVWNTYWMSVVGLFLGCIAAYLMASYGKRGDRKQYMKCILLSAAGLVLSFIPFFIPDGHVVQWSFGVGMTGITVAPGVILNLVVLVMAWIRMRKKHEGDIR